MRKRSIRALSPVRESSSCEPIYLSDAQRTQMCVPAAAGPPASSTPLDVDASLHIVAQLPASIQCTKETGRRSGHEGRENMHR